MVAEEGRHLAAHTAPAVNWQNRSRPFCNYALHPFRFPLPRIVEAIMRGELPEVSITQLAAIKSPIWSKQEKALGLSYNKQKRSIDTEKKIVQFMA